MKARNDQEKIALLKSLAAQGFGQLDRGRGIKIRGRRQLANFIARIGHRAATASKPDSSRF